jgi:hypothetical protein
MRLLLSILLFISFSHAVTQKTMCYKQSIGIPSNIESKKFEGGECKGEKSIDDMKNEGWSIDNVKIMGSDYIYILKKEATKEVSFDRVKKTQNTIKLNFNEKSTAIYNVKENSAYIKIGNLKVGQSGIITHKSSDGTSIILANAIVVDTNKNESKIEFEYFSDIVQTALPKSNLKVTNSDIFVLNHLYNTSIIVAPNSESFRNVRKIFRNINFLHTDIFSSDLKRENIEKPEPEHFKIFCKYQNISTIFFVIKNRVYIVDAKSFKILQSHRIYYKSEEAQLPFYTRVEFKTFGFFSFFKSEVENYNSYYSNMLGI